jgi:F-type H+-transporting ATPase subunit alpha
VFYLHSRLLERACKLAEKRVIVPADTPDDRVVQAEEDDVFVGPLGKARAEQLLEQRDDAEKLKLHVQPDSGGSMTALPICETQEGEVSAYIPTNLIGITDGQLYLEPALFFAGVRPAINVGISVSRVGYKAAIPAMKRVAASLRLDLAAYRELESFAQLGMELDEDSQARLDRGERMVQLLIQPQYQPMDPLEQAVQIFAGTDGQLDDLPVDQVGDFLAGITDYLKTEHPEFWEEYAADMDLPKDRARRLSFLIEEYRDSVFNERKRSGGVAEPSGQ